MNTNSNAYTVIYTTIVVVLVAAILAFVSQILGPKQADNQKAETISQILTAAQFENFGDNNSEKIDFYKKNISEVALYNAAGEQIGNLDCEKAEIYSTSDLKAQNYNVKDEAKADAIKIPVYKFSNGVSVVPVYGAGLWGPVWGYIAVDSDMATIVGAFFDHDSETPGLGGKIKDDPSFRAQFAGKSIDFTDAKPFNIVKGGAPEGKANAIDAITGATMTSKGLDAAISTWLNAYKPVFEGAAAAAAEVEAADDAAEEAVESNNEVEE